MTDIFSIIGLWFSALIAILVLGFATFCITWMGSSFIVKRLSQTYRWASVYYYMGVCLKYGRTGMLKEVEEAKKEMNEH